MTNTAYAYFAIYGDFDPTEITQVTGVTPTDVWVKGQMRAGRSMQLSMWKLVSTLGQDRPLEEHIRNVLARLDTKADAFRCVSRQFDGTMHLVAEFLDWPGLHFERDIIDGLANYALAVDFDFYSLSSSEREDL